jgi:hypothetical protein
MHGQLVKISVHPIYFLHESIKMPSSLNRSSSNLSLNSFFLEIRQSPPDCKGKSKSQVESELQSLSFREGVLRKARQRTAEVNPERLSNRQRGNTGDNYRLTFIDGIKSLKNGLFAPGLLKATPSLDE